MLYGTLATAVRVGANLLLLPLVLKVLAPPELALWYVFLALGGIANLADFGFGQAIARVYSFLWAGAQDFEVEGLGPPPESREPNRSRIGQFHYAVRRLYFWIALAGIGLLLTIGTWSVMRPVSAVSQPQFAWLCWVGFILSITFNLATGHWVIAAQGINRMRELQAAYLVSGLIYVIAAAALLLAGWALAGLVAATLLRAIVARQMCKRACLEAVPQISTPATVELASIMKRIWPNARKFGMISLGAYLVFHANVLVCSYFLGSEVTASYGVTSQVGYFIAGFSALWLTVKWPQLTILRTQGRLEEMSVIFARRLAFASGSFLILAVGFAAFGNLVLEWTDTQTRFLALPLLTVFLFTLFQQQFYAHFGSLVYTENVVPFFKLSVFSGLAVIVASVIMTYLWGIWGLILSPLIVTFTTCAWYVTRRGFQGQALSVRQFMRAAIVGRL